MESVRKKLDDPAFAGFFIRLDPHRNPKLLSLPACNEQGPNVTKCSKFFHDTGQTPGYVGKTCKHKNDGPEPAAIGCPGNCNEAPCDCGNNPCGEYLVRAQGPCLPRTATLLLCTWIEFWPKQESI